MSTKTKLERVVPIILKRAVSTRNSRRLKIINKNNMYEKTKVFGQ